MNRETEKKDIRLTVILIASVILLAAAAFIINLLVSPKAVTGQDPVNLKDGTPITGEEAKAYVLCRFSANDSTGFLPLPEDGEDSFPIRLTAEDGTETENVLHLTPDGFYMESATCKNQNCVRQGTVTLENREWRAMQNCVVCLPNGVTAELYSADEVRRMLSESETSSK